MKHWVDAWFEFAKKHKINPQQDGRNEIVRVYRAGFALGLQGEL